MRCNCSVRATRHSAMARVKAFGQLLGLAEEKSQLAHIPEPAPGRTEMRWEFVAGQARNGVRHISEQEANGLRSDLVAMARVNGEQLKGRQLPGSSKAT